MVTRRSGCSGTTRPPILFLHGALNAAPINLLQLLGTFGAISQAKRIPDLFVMAPHAPDYGAAMLEFFIKMI